MRTVRLYTDGACSPNPGVGGWAFLLEDPVTGYTKEDSGYAVRTTNNRMELLAVIRGLIVLNQICLVHLYSDSRYVCGGILKKKRSPNVPNLDLWELLDAHKGVHKIEPHWVRGHSGHPQNERCDQLATEAISRYREYLDSKKGR